MATPLLDPTDGSASMATMIMTSHFAFRRDLACFAEALAAFDASRAAALQAEWTQYRTALHHHHVVEDTAIFPDMRAKHPDIAGAIDELDAQHRAIDPLLERGDRTFADLATHRAEASEIVAALRGLLATHLDLEERTVIPHLRSAKEFPPLPDDQLPSFAEGFAWSTAGLAAAVIAKIDAMLPAGLVAHLPAARRAFDERSVRAFGRTHAGSSHVSAPA